MHPSHTSTPELKQVAATERLQQLFRSRNLPVEHCGQPLDADSLEWWRGSTEYGTDCGGVIVVCLACGEELAEVSTWGPPEDVLDAAEVLEDEADSLPRDRW